MNVKYDSVNELWLVDSPETTLEACCLSLGFGVPGHRETSHDACLVAGRTREGTIRVFDGKVGYLDEVADKVVRMKHQYFVKVCYCPPNPEEMVRYYRKLNGLTFYREEQIPFTNDYKPVDPPETWEDFRSYEHHCEVVADRRTHEEYTTWVKHVEHLLKRGATLPKSKFPALRKYVRRVGAGPTNLQHSIMQCLVYAFARLYQPPVAPGAIPTAKPAYPNLRR